VPLLVGGRAVGVLGLSFNHAGPFSAEDKEFVVSLTRQCAQALERARLFEAERRARAEAERASEAKSEFLATLSHELRTPLTPVLLTVSLMESHPGLPEDLREDVATIRRNVELESRLISDLLDLTRVSRGKLQLDTQDVDLHLILRAAIDICQREASARLSLDLRAARHMVRGDSTRLQQVFWNLINNAQKFTPPEGSITVRSTNAGDNRIRVEVIDTGTGIDAALLPRLFNAFEQGEGRTAWQQAGLGLGLAISRKLAEAHGGTVTASSAGRGHGATFTVELPVVDVFVPEVVPPAHPRESGGAGAETRAAAAGPSLAVLVVEDHEPTLRIMSKLLRGLGHRVTGATTVASATAAARQDGFDLIISDLGLPDGSGLDVMRQLRDRFEGRAIALTGYGMESDIAASRDAGFVEHITKPVDLTKLQGAIERVTAPHGRSSSVPRDSR
jgi:signal transduction histidine kinase/CheY-like chemotaxis protein